jgi:predicted phage terminase large subunit-like protein
VLKIDEEISLLEGKRQRRNARRDFAEWCRLTGHEPAKHHLYLIDKLQKVVRGEIKRLAIFLPPGSAKSYYASVRFPPWFLAQKPDTAILSCSHSADFAETFGRRARNLIIDKEKVLGYGLTEDSQAAGRWATDNGGEFSCAGVGGRIAGRRADLGLIDDPVGSKEDAYSKLIRDRTWDWYNFDFRTRLKPNASVVLIQTRWHEDDLAGRILASEGAEWDVVSIPLIALENDPIGRKPGERLWPEYFNDALVADAMKDNDVFNCLWQQNPIPETGDFFKREWIEPYGYQANELPKELRIYVGSDHAVSLQETADFTCLLPSGLDENDTLWILPDLFWNKADSEKVVEEMTGMMLRRRPFTWWAERGHISKSLGPFLAKRMQERGCYSYIEEVTPTRDKQTRAQSIRARMKAGKVRWPVFASWFPQALHEMLAFPAGKHDDFVDALAHLGMGLDRMLSAEGIKTPVEFSAPSLETLTLRWLKDSDRREKNKREIALLDY